MVSCQRLAVSLVALLFGSMVMLTIVCYAFDSGSLTDWRYYLESHHFVWLAVDSFSFDRESSLYLWVMALMMMMTLDWYSHWICYFYLCHSFVMCLIANFLRLHSSTNVVMVICSPLTRKTHYSHYSKLEKKITFNYSSFHIKFSSH